MITPSSHAAPEVLIAGAGPTGLVLAIWLTRLGARVRIVDRLPAPETTSRAIGVQARTLEFYRQFGFADTLIAHGRKAPAVNLSVSGRVAARLPFYEMGGNITPFPFALVISQDEHERLLIEHLAALGVEVERGTEVAGLEAIPGGVRVSLKHPGGAGEICEAAWLAGCDGARSTVRESLGIAFAGGTHAFRFYVADVHASGPAMNGEMHVALDAMDFLAVFPLPGQGRARLIGTVRDDGGAENNGGPGWPDVNKSVLEAMRLDIHRVNWFSTFRVHHRIAARFRAGRIFLAGDAAHIHTPVGGQGLNAGVGDAVNLGWKLAAVLRGRAAAAILDTYHPERAAFARKLVDTTDRVFRGVTSQKPFDRWARSSFVPFMLPRLLKLPPVGRFLFTLISQAGVQYRASRLSEGRAGGVHAGDRLPWVKPAPGRDDNFAPLGSLDWQVHIYGEAAPEIRAFCAARKLPLRIFPWGREMALTGLRRHALYLIRPDGHVALAGAGERAEPVAAYLDALRIVSANPPPS